MNEQIKADLLRVTQQIRDTHKSNEEILFHYLVRRFPPAACDYIPPHMVRKEKLEHWSLNQIRSALQNLSHLGLLNAEFSVLTTGDADEFEDIPSVVDVDFGVIGVESIDLKQMPLWNWKYPNKFCNPNTGEWQSVHDIVEHYSATDLLMSFMKEYRNGGHISMEECLIKDI